MQAYITDNNYEYLHIMLFTEVKSGNMYSSTLNFSLYRVLIEISGISELCDSCYIMMSENYNKTGNGAECNLVMFIFSWDHLRINLLLN